MVTNIFQGFFARGHWISNLNLEICCGHEIIIAFGENFIGPKHRYWCVMTTRHVASWNWTGEQVHLLEKNPLGTSCQLLVTCVCVFIPFHRTGFSWLKQNNKCNARDQVSDVVLRKSLCVKYIHHHIIDNHSRDLQASNCARVSIKPGGATRNKRQLLELSENQR